MQPVRLLSYNIRSLRDDPAAVVRVVRAIAPDVVCLQEVPRFGAWRLRRRRLARACGLRIAAGRRACGLAVLAAPHVRRVAREFHLLTPDRGLHRRALAIAVLESGGARFVAASTHLDLAGGPRLRHVREVIGHLDRASARHGAPVVLAGDINEEPGGPAWTLLAGRFRDAFAAAPAGGAATFPARAPRRRIDAVFADPSIAVAGCGVPAGGAAPAADYARATDHLPLAAELRIGAEASKDR
ncbi:endonuclease/exonuclease/phosphatase family metal-dependent hydrolase [Actinomadura hallensis]|uniref:Endonuclease/exonuclease/phosphatase family metal-dependent hydrolase n=1 Tax=Actinomadura hallensis TaxID=337895 RepID=A0A543IHV4_9ACTN|nr:endonuclease/exonuclease/phosphatase family protein [Actinomadura hallensis]TQM70130.1 endonuclease/exonuclease/phosphatase family metal-dependent hydrolase [Actinomadura hallensis]HLV72602.1 endonuclease/exonuclease/phosphatase family protein [Vulgatibacteraceae bacterium]